MPMVEFYAYLLEKKLVTPKIISVTNAHGGWTATRYRHRAHIVME